MGKASELGLEEIKLIRKEGMILGKSKLVKGKEVQSREASQMEDALSRPPKALANHMNHLGRKWMGL